jgi:hypothetical protein
MTRLQARQILRDLGLTLTGRFDGQGYLYSVKWADDEDIEAYRTYSLLDAVDEGVRMAEALNDVNAEAI